MISLAPLRYARVLKADRGPIDRIEYTRLVLGGRGVYQANAFLSDRLNLQRPGNRVFSAADGTGTHESGMVARYKAISEAIERWALYYLLQSGHGKACGFDTDPTSTGMAAYPGLFAWQARGRALTEAAERFCLVGWWAGDLADRNLQERILGIRGIEIENPVSRDRVVLVWSNAPNGYRAYGFAGAKRLDSAYGKAVVELERARAALGRFFKENPGFEEEDLETLENPFERRIVYYALPAGHEIFMSRVTARKTPKPCPRSQIKPVVDCRINGPWNRYATVWRVLYPMATRDYLRDYLNTFYW